MLDMMSVLGSCEPLSSPSLSSTDADAFRLREASLNDDARKALGVRLHDELLSIARDVEECAKICDHYQKKNTTGSEKTGPFSQSAYIILQ